MMEYEHDAVAKEMMQSGFSIRHYNQGSVNVSYGITKDVGIEKVTEILGLDPAESEYFQSCIFEYLPEVGVIQWCVDATAGIYESFSIDSPEGLRLKKIMLECL
jgi:hypothetical protein